MTDNFQNLKTFWKNIIKIQQKKCSFKDNDFSVSNWKEKIDQIKSYKELDELGRKLRREVVSKVYVGASKELMVNEEKEYVENALEILNDYQKEINLLKNQDDISKSTIDTYENSIKEFQNKIKAIIGDDLTNWETKITKAGDKNITDLQSQVGSLTIEKNDLQKQLKEKQDQIINHKCDTPNNSELNQLKDDLKKANQEKERLQTELGQNNPNAPIQIPQQREEEDKKEELENQNLTLEELRKKLSSKQSEIRDLQEQLTKQNFPSVQNNKKDYSQFLFGIAVSFLIVAVIGGMVYVVNFYKKKKKTA